MQRSPATAPTIARLIEAFHRLPGIGPKSAQRLAYHVLRAPRAEAESLAEALLEVKGLHPALRHLPEHHRRRSVRALPRSATIRFDHLRGRGAS